MPTGRTAPNGAHPVMREDSPIGASSSASAAEGSGRFWRRAGLFGLVYLGALVAFAAAFDVWPTAGR
jgi:hypothetical protein